MESKSSQGKGYLLIGNVSKCCPEFYFVKRREKKHTHIVYWFLLFCYTTQLDWCYAVGCTVFALHPQQCSVIFVLQYRHDPLCRNTPPRVTRAVFRGLLSQIQPDGKGCGGVEGWLGRKGWQQRSLKNVLLLRYLCHAGFFCNNSLVTWLHRQTPRLLTGLWHWQAEWEEEEEKEEEQRKVCAPNNSIWLVQFIYSQPVRAYSGSLAIYYHFLSAFYFSLCLSEHGHLTARRTHFPQPPLTYHLHTPQRASYRDAR